MSTRNVAVTKTALAKARVRRQELDRARDVQDQRIEQAAAAALVALDARADAERALAVASADVAEALRTLLTEGVSAQRAGALLDMETSDVRRLSKPPSVCGFCDGRSTSRLTASLERPRSATTLDECAIENRAADSERRAG
jgi:hypothetical protein